MNIVKITDGLGNQMFQYAFARNLQIKTGKMVYLDTRFINHEDIAIHNESNYSIKKNGFRTYGLDKFKIKIDIADHNILKHWDYLSGKNDSMNHFWKYYDEQKNGINLYPILPAYYRGGFFNLKYYDDIKTILRKEFVLKQKLKLSDILKKALDDSNTVSIHIRRGDFLKLNRNISQKEYYPRALRIVYERIDNPTFLVFSDDIEWVKNNLKIEGDHLYVSMMGFQDHEEMMIMKHCKHNIIANSTFSYWAAYLNANPDKIVICPRNWKSEIIPDDWIRV